MSEDSDLYYVYGIVRAGFDTTNAPAGLEDAAVRTSSGAGVQALVSRLPATTYGPDAIERNSGSVDWVSPRAKAHDRVLTWAHDHGGVLPMPMFSMWRSEATLQRWLAGEAGAPRAVVRRHLRG